MSPRNVTIQALTVAILLCLVITANARGNAKSKSVVAPAKSRAMVASKSPTMANLSTNIHFDGLDVNGRRQSPFGASAVVENEKETPNLIDYRSNYEDRIQRSQSGR